MKALSVKQPFAMALVMGQKTVELRSWATTYRGPLLICASATEKDVWFKMDGEHFLLPAGCMVGIVELVNCRKATRRDEYAAMSQVSPGDYAWEIDPQTVLFVKPEKVKGKLRLFDVPDDSIVRLTGDDWCLNYPSPQGEIKLSKKSIIIDLHDTPS